MYEPILMRNQVLQSRLSEEAFEKRVAKARKASRTMKALERRIEGGKSLNQAIEEVLPKSRRSWAIRNWPKYRTDGWEGLIQANRGREPNVTQECEDVVIAARLANPRITLEAMNQILQDRKVTPLPSEAVVKRIFTRADGRRRSAKKKAEPEQKEGKVVELALAGAELLLAAEMETKGIEGLTQEVVQRGQEALEESKGKVPKPDRERRDTKGRFTAEYNRARRRKPGEPTAGYLRPAADKGAEKVASWARFVHEKAETVEQKVKMLVFEPLVNQNKGWNGLRAAPTQDLQEVLGYAYMPSTLAKFSSALAQADGGPRMLERVGKVWHQVAEKNWGESGAMAALYVDNHVKPVWTSQYTQSGKVSRLNQVMPCLTTTYVHSGAGTPVVVVVKSGTASLAPKLVELVEQAEKQLGTEIGRAVVIDAEGSTFDILSGYKGKRVIVTPLKPGQAGKVEITYRPGSYYRPYRERDELRVAQVVLHHKSTGRSVELHALMIRRPHRESDTVLLTTGIELGMSGRELADLYYRRWPVQENAFREGAAVKLAQHRGNCGDRVVNVAVVTELEKNQFQDKALTQKLTELQAQGEERVRSAEQAHRVHQQAQQKLKRYRKRVDELGSSSESVRTAERGRAVEQHHQALMEAEAAAATYFAAEQKRQQHQEAHDKAASKTELLRERAQKLKPQQIVRRVDVSLDTVMTAVKLTAAQLIAFVLRMYLVSMPMTAETFVSRVLSIKGRREIREDQERVVFYENPRDPEINAVLTQACQRLNTRELHRNGKRVFYEIRPPPPAAPQ